MIPIPISQKATVEVTATKMNLVECAHCGMAYVYEMQVKGSASATGFILQSSEQLKQQAAARATKVLESTLQTATDMVACPACGMFQKAMIKQWRELQRGIWFVVSLFLAVITGFLWFLSADSVRVLTPATAHLILAFTWIPMTLIFIWLCVRDPNRNHAANTRERLGVKCRAIPWAEIQQAIAKQQATEPATPPDRQELHG